MALIVEDGTIVTNAESLASVAYADSYHSKRGHTAWAALAESAKEAALINATDYLRQYRSRWKGYRVSALQVLDFPRYGMLADPYVQDAVGATPYFIASNVVPTDVKDAVCELALRSAEGTELFQDLTPAVVSETVGPISTTYSQTDPQYTRFSVVDSMLAPYLNGSSMNMRVVSRY